MRRWFRFSIKMAIIIAFLAAFMSQNILALEINYEGSALWNNIYDLDVEEQYAYCLFLNGLGIIDVSDPTSPVWIGQYYISNDYYYWRQKVTGRISVSGGYAFIASDTVGLVILNVQDPHNPTLASTILDQAWHVHVDGNYAYVAAGSFGLKIINITDPSSPAIVGSYGSTAYGYIFADSNYVYFSSESQDLQIIDVSDPTSPVLVGLFDTEGSSVVFVAGNRLYTIYNGISILDITDRSNPTLLSTYAQAGTVTDLYEKDNYLYAADTYGLMVFDVSNPSNPVYCGLENAILHCNGLDIEGELAFTGPQWYNASHGLAVIDISNPLEPTKTGEYESYPEVEFLYVSDTHAYVVHRDIGLSIVDITDPSSPIVESFLAMNGEAQGVYGYGDYVYVADGYAGLEIVDVQEPENPIIVGNYHPGTRSYFSEVFIADSLAYVANTISPRRMTILDLSDPINPAVLGEYYVPGRPFLICVEGNYAYLSMESVGLHIIDVTDPTTPVFAGEFNENAPSSIWGMDVRGDYLYIAQMYSLKIIDVSDPTNPIKVASSHAGNSVNGVVLSGNYAFVGKGHWGIRAYDVSDPLNPIGILDIITPGRVEELFINDGNLFACNIYSLQIYSFGATPCSFYVTGDVNNSGAYDGLDIIYGVNYFKGGPPPPYECECTPGNIWHVAGDVNGSCNYNGLDITYGVAYFKGGPDPIPCPDCPPN
ncbi:MAG: hypothetical protein JSW64_02755 [Candidatus Zixiibacteriota bacterium]|nr:MAG: hypothetical protein JSW64_02755 [candidate division Zixibacteria bacterium]